MMLIYNTLESHYLQTNMYVLDVWRCILLIYIYRYSYDLSVCVLLVYYMCIYVCVICVYICIYVCVYSIMMEKIELKKYIYE